MNEVPGLAFMIVRPHHRVTTFAGSSFLTYIMVLQALL